ncbi:DEAD/DEAH box helicase [Streptomyces sp. AJS327]|uniref:DEAD/DEAH box helicase n=1 Tax=Streptomyces sp. AJS327 TaxID=2545265 RepID=UPI0015E00295|nr:DEAD/DEAH box helicase [Streptomyces sp. AJS327]MBA0052437.1 DEAD/DEAH box helicase [Streptomyces sp. AJS327]
MPPPTTPPGSLLHFLHCSAVLLPADPPRASRIAFWHPDGAPPPPEAVEAVDSAAEAAEVIPLTVVLPAAGREAPATPLPGGGPEVAATGVTALALPVHAALPVLTRAHAAGSGGSAEFWGAASLFALHLIARGRLLPGLSPAAYDAWRVGPLDPADIERCRHLAAAMPPSAHAVPLAGTGPDGADPGTAEADGGAGRRAPRLADPEELLRAFLDAVADGLPRTPAAGRAAGGPVFATWSAHHVPEQREWAAAVAAGHDAGVRLSLRIEVDGLTPEDGSGARYRAVLELAAADAPERMADAVEVWSGASAASHFGHQARTEALLTLRRAAASWEPLTPLLSAAVPDAVDLAEEEVAELLSGPVDRALRAAGVRVRWPRELFGEVTAHAVVGAEEDTAGDAGRPGSGALDAESLLGFHWRFAVGDSALTRAELDQLAEAGRPLVRMRDRWMLVDPAAVRDARERRDTRVAPLEALGAALTGSTEHRGERVRVEAAGRLRELAGLLSAPEGAVADPVPAPPELHAELRDYQLRGLGWLHRTLSLGLGCVLADDMGLGKTVTLIALHLHRQRSAETAGATLVVCPASLLGNWQREIERFAPGTPVRRYHGPGRRLGTPEPGKAVLTTYGTMRLDAGHLAEADWGLVVADEAQHVKNPFSSTARRLRAVPSRARVALTGTPVENNLSELWAILDWATPGLLGRLGTFRRQYADAVEGGDPFAAERLGRLVRPFLLRRHKTDPGIAPELPPKTETDRAVALSTEQVALYEAVVREGLGEVSGSEGMARRGLVVRLLTSLKQICNHPAQYLGESEPGPAGRSGKFELLDELLGSILAEGSAVLVFTQYVAMGRLLERHLAERGVPTAFLHGGTPVARREELVRRFQEGAVPVFLLSLKAAGTGLNLTRAEHVVHVDRWWNPAVEAQATDRAYRIGQDRAVQVHRLVAEGTVEDRVARLLESKRALAEAVLGSGEAGLTELSDAELADLVGLREEER